MMMVMVQAAEEMNKIVCLPLFRFPRRYNKSLFLVSLAHLKIIPNSVMIVSLLFVADDVLCVSLAVS